MSASREEMLQNIETINTCITTNVSFKNTPVKFRNIIGKIYEETAPEGSTTTWEQIRSKLLEQLESRYPQSNWNGNAAVPPSPPAPEWQGPALPPGWVPQWSKTKGKFYFYNIVTKEKTWRMPPAVPVQAQRDAAAEAAPYTPRSGRLMDPSPLFVGGSFTGSSSPAATAVGQGFYSEEEVPRQPPRSSLYLTRPKSWGGRGVSPSEGGANWRGGSRKKKCARKTRKVKSRNKKKAF